MVLLATSNPIDWPAPDWLDGNPKISSFALVIVTSTRSFPSGSCNQALALICCSRKKFNTLEQFKIDYQVIIIKIIGVRAISLLKNSFVKIGLNSDYLVSIRIAYIYYDHS